MIPQVCIVLVSLLLMACTIASVSYRVMESGTNAGLRSPSLYSAVIVDAEQYAQLYQKLHASELPRPTPPAIDFATSYVLLLALEEKPTAGYRVEIVRIERRGKVLNVHLHLEEPLRGRVQAMVITQPFVMAQVAREAQVRRVDFLDQNAQVLASHPVPAAATP